jgi:hypothetical protein
MRKQGYNSLHDILPGVSNVLVGVRDAYYDVDDRAPTIINEDEEHWMRWIQGDSINQVKVTFEEVLPELIPNGWWPDLGRDM